MPERATVMIAVKAAPEIGRRYGETVCVAGVRLDRGAAEWIRLFPVQRSWFFGRAHPKYQTIELEIEKHAKDLRPESYRPDLESFVEVAPPSRDWAKRGEVLSRLEQYTMCDLRAQKGWARPSLGLVVPREVTAVTWEDNGDDPRQRAMMNRAAQGSLLVPNAPKLAHCPISFRHKYTCWAPLCRGHEHTIVDWEISEAWRRWRASYDDYLDRIRDRWDSLRSDSETASHAQRW